MPTITKIIKVPADRRLKLEIDLPEDMPTGNVEMALTLSPASEEDRRRYLLGFAGIFKGHPAFKRGGVAIQRELRAEWDREWDRVEEEDGSE